MKQNGVIAPLLHIHHPQNSKELRGYYRLSSHFKWALTQVFINRYSTLLSHLFIRLFFVY